MSLFLQSELLEGKRFKFGEIWSCFLKLLDEKRIVHAEKSLSEMLDVINLNDKSFLDVGCGSGLFSLAARRLGAKVHSFDFDPASIACTLELKQRYFPDEKNWLIEEASVLDDDYLSRLGKFDVVYSWGVLHHTGKMRQALGNVTPLVSEGGSLFISIYHDQGLRSIYWSIIKRMYNISIIFKVVIILIHFPFLYLLRYILRFISCRQIERGMSLWYDMLDWLGGFPFEVSKPQDIIHFYNLRGFYLTCLKSSSGRSGCNEYVFLKGSLNNLVELRDKAVDCSI